MAKSRALGWALLGAATTKLARVATRRAMHTRRGAPRLPRAARRQQTIGMLVMLAGAAGMMMAFADVLQEQRTRVTERPY